MELGIAAQGAMGLRARGATILRVLKAQFIFRRVLPGLESVHPGRGNRHRKSCWGWGWGGELTHCVCHSSPTLGPKSAQAPGDVTPTWVMRPEGIDCVCVCVCVCVSV